MRTTISLILVLLSWSTDVFADIGKGIENIPWNLFFIVLSGIVGYVVGTIKSFREEKQKAYGEMIAPILKMAYNPQDSVDEKEYSKALSKLWLYGSKAVTRKMEAALEVIHDHSKGDVTRALQEAVAEMRKDIQLSPFQKKLKPQDVNHLYTKIGGAGMNLPKFEALRKIKSVTSNIPPDLNRAEIENKLTVEPEFLEQLSNRLVRLFGLRNELVPFIEPEILDLIDQQLEPLYKIENGSYTFRREKISELAAFVDSARSLVAVIEERLTKEYRGYTK